MLVTTELMGYLSLPTSKSFVMFYCLRKCFFIRCTCFTFDGVTLQLCDTHRLSHWTCDLMVRGQFPLSKSAVRPFLWGCSQSIHRRSSRGSSLSHWSCKSYRKGGQGLPDAILSKTLSLFLLMSIPLFLTTNPVSPPLSVSLPWITFAFTSSPLPAL